MILQRKNTPINYRQDIDGLRAIAVMSVILNHMGFFLFSGGYVGVDVFFVISGFLITKIITRKLHQKSFSFIEFYQKRMRRILPALYLVIIITAVFVSLMFSLEEVKFFYKSVQATILFFSNIQFYKDVGYFSLDAFFKPLLHTWSLGVEEQFYIVFPVLLYGLCKFLKTPKKLAYAFILILVISFGLNVFTVFNNKNMAFYFSHTRAWEFLIGAIFALDIIPNLRKNWQQQLIAVSGFLLIMVPVFFYSSTTLFPGYNALPPVLGSAFLIYSGTQKKTIIYYLLSRGPVVFIGLISYSLYLWHWPIVSLNNYWGMVQGQAFFGNGILLTLIMAASILSWYFIERPFQNKKFISTKTISILLLSLTVGFLIVSKISYRTNKFDDFLADKETILYSEDYLFDKKYIDLGCNVGASKIKAGELCTFGSKNKKHIDFILWGDSYLETLAPAFEIAAEKNNKKFSYAVQHGCPVILDVPIQGASRGSECNVSNAFIWNYIKQQNIKNIIIHLSYNYGNIKLDKNHRCYEFKKTDRFNCLFEDTIDTLQKEGINISVIGPMARGVKPIKLRRYKNNKKDHQLPKLKSDSETIDLIKGFNKLIEKNKINYYDPVPVLCTDKFCKAENNKKPLFSDGGHLSKYGVLMFIEFAEDIISKIKN